MNANRDLCVVGAGLAGLAAAVRAAELGSRVVVLEQSPDLSYLCNSRMTSGMFHLALRPVTDAPDLLASAVQHATHGWAHRGLTEVLAKHAERGVRWLMSHGVRFFRASPVAHHGFTIAPPATYRSGPFDILGRGGDVLLRRLEASLIRLGGEILRGHRATSLILEGGRCVGVEGSIQGTIQTFTIRSHGTVIADGGFQANTSLLARFDISPAPSMLVQRNARSGRGDGLLMAEAAGAALTDMRGFYGHLQSRDALSNDRLWPYPWLDLVANAALMVDAYGQRFCDEGRGGVNMANQVAALRAPSLAWVIFDQATWNGAGRAYLKAPNPRLLQGGGTLLSAANFDDLALSMGISNTTFKNTLKDWNDAVGSGRLSRLRPERSVGAVAVAPLVHPPFFAAPVAAGITHTMGGIAIDEWSRAHRDSNGEIFSGLYAAGSASGGIEGGAQAGYVGGLTKALVTGLRASEHLCSTMSAKNI